MKKPLKIALWVTLGVICVPFLLAAAFGAFELIMHQQSVDRVVSIEKSIEPLGTTAVCDTNALASYVRVLKVPDSPHLTADIYKKVAALYPNSALQKDSLNSAFSGSMPINKFDLIYQTSGYGYFEIQIYHSDSTTIESDTTHQCNQNRDAPIGKGNAAIFIASSYPNEQY